MPPGSEILSINSFGDGKYCALVQVVEQQNRNILISYSTNQGTTWSGYQPLANSNLDELNPFFITTQDGKSRVIYNLKKPTPFSDHFQNDVFYMETADNGLNWSVPKQITKAVSDDYVLSVSSYGTVAQVLFKTNRASDANIKSGYQLAFSVVDENIDLSQPPHVYSVSVDLHSPAQSVLTIRAYVHDETLISSVKCKNRFKEFIMYDDGQHGDSLANDFIYGCIIPVSEIHFNNTIMINNIGLSFNNYGFLASGYFNVDLTILIKDESNKNFSFNLEKTIKKESDYQGCGFLLTGGFLLSGYANNFLWVNGMTGTRVVDYLPGKVGSSSDDPKNKIYWIRRSDPPFGQSWQEWKDAVSLGAYFYDGDGDGVYNPIDKNLNGIWDRFEDMPDILGDVTAFTVFNDGVPANKRIFSDVSPLGIEIRQTIFASNSSPKFENTVFVRYSIIYRGTNPISLDSVIFAVWSDEDLGTYYNNDLIGTDTLLNSKFVYDHSSDLCFRNNPPAIFTTILQKPYFYTGNIQDTAYNNKGSILGQQKLVGYRYADIKSSLFHGCQLVPDFYAPKNRFEARNYMMGLSSSGKRLNPCTFAYGTVAGGVNCNAVNPRFLFSGDPVTGSGWLHTSPFDVITLLSTDHFTLKANEPVDIIYAYTIGRGIDNINSVAVTRNLVRDVISEYNSNFSSIASIENPRNIPKEFELFQNYPNPFNSITRIMFTIPRAEKVEIKVYDILGRQVAVLLNENK